MEGHIVEEHSGGAQWRVTVEEHGGGASRSASSVYVRLRRGVTDTVGSFLCLDHSSTCTVFPPPRPTLITVVPFSSGASEVAPTPW